MMSVDMIGDDRVLKKMLALEKRELNKGARKAVRAGRKPMLGEVRTRAARLERVGTGMGEAISAAAKVRMLKARTLRSIGVKSGAGAYIYFDTNRFPQLIHYPRGSYSYTAKRKTRRGTRIVRKTHGKRSFIPHAIEFGHAGPGNHGGAKVAAPKPFIRPAHAATRSKSIAAGRKVFLKHVVGYWDSNKV